MITRFKKVLAPTWQKIALTILLFLIIIFLSVVLAFSTVGSGKGGTLDYISFFILMLINPGVFLTPLVGLLFINQGQTEPQGQIILQIISVLGTIFQIAYLYVIISIVFYLG
jgi:hypothetical protein